MTCKIHYPLYQFDVLLAMSFILKKSVIQKSDQKLYITVKPKQKLN